MRLSHRLAPGERLLSLAQGRHGLLDGGEIAMPAHGLLNGAVPPRLPIRLPGRSGQDAERIVGEMLLLAPILAHGQGNPCRQVDESDGTIAGQGPADGLPFRRVFGEGIEHGEAWIVGRVAEQGDRRHEIGGGRGVQDRLALGRPLDQHHGRVQRIQFPQQGVGGAGPVVPDAEEMGALAQAATSLIAR
jgi:hypothetical protein